MTHTGDSLAVVTDVARTSPTPDSSLLVQIQTALVKELGRANREAEHVQRVAAAPYSGHERLADMHTARGIQQGLAMALDIFDEVVRRG